MAINKELRRVLIDRPNELLAPDIRTSFPEWKPLDIPEAVDFQVKVFEGEVFAVDSKSYSLQISADGGRILRNIIWLSPYGHPDGNGNYAMPQPGCRVLIVEVAPSRYIATGFLPAQKRVDNNYRNNRKNINQGDLCFMVKDSCFIQIHKNAEHLEFVASNACWMKLDGTANHISASAHRFTFHADGGSVDWNSDPKTDNTWFEGRFRDLAEKGATHVTIRAGYHDVEDEEAQIAEIDKSVFSIIVNEVEHDAVADTTTEKDPTFKFIVGRNGRILISAESVKEFYRDYIERHVETTITNIAQEKINRVSSTEIHDQAPIIRHNP